MKKIIKKVLSIIVLVMMTNLSHAAEFGPNSANLTNTYQAWKVGYAIIESGYGFETGHIGYFDVVGTEVVDGVKCVRVNHIRTHDSDYAFVWYAEDISGNLYALQWCEFDTQLTCTEVGKDNASLVIPKNPKVGDKLSGSRTILEIGVTVPQLSTGLGPFTNCLKAVETDNDIVYYAPNIGMVKKDYSDGSGGWELSEIIKTKSRVAVVIPLFD